MWVQVSARDWEYFRFWGHVAVRAGVLYPVFVFSVSLDLQVAIVCPFNQHRKKIGFPSQSIFCVLSTLQKVGVEACFLWCSVPHGSRNLLFVHAIFVQQMWILAGYLFFRVDGGVLTEDTSTSGDKSSIFTRYVVRQMYERRSATSSVFSVLYDSFLVHSSGAKSTTTVVKLPLQVICVVPPNTRDRHFLIVSVQEYYFLGHWTKNLITDGRVRNKSFSLQTAYSYGSHDYYIPTSHNSIGYLEKILNILKREVNSLSQDWACFAIVWYLSAERGDFFNYLYRVCRKSYYDFPHREGKRTLWF